MEKNQLNTQEVKLPEKSVNFMYFPLFLVKGEVGGGGGGRKLSDGTYIRIFLFF